jgi:23S rRNA pseudouridine2605 synthase
VKLDDGPTAPAKVRRLGPTELELTIHEGRNRQVKRMLEAVGHRVIELQRVSFGSLELGTLREGAARKLKAAEVDALRRLAEAGPARGSSR